MKAYVVLFQYSPNGRNDKGEFYSNIADNRFFKSKAIACEYIKNKYNEIFEKEKRIGMDLDEEWGLAFSDEYMKEIGYSWSDDFSVLTHEFENIVPDEKPEPKFSWKVIEIEGDI